MLFDYKESYKRLEPIGKYKQILDHLGTPTSPNWSFVFELLFVNEFVTYGHFPEYEENINPISNKTIDFIIHDKEDFSILFELIRPEMREILQVEYDRKMFRGGITLSSDNENEYLRPEEQTIRLQEKLLGKVEKFPEPDDKTFSVIVVDCSNFHFGHFDDNDAYMVMYGFPRNSFYNECWNGKRILGLLENNHKARETSDFQRKITAVIFIPMLQVNNLLSRAKIVLNSLRAKQHRILFQNISNILQPINNLKWL